MLIHCPDNYPYVWCEYEVIDGYVKEDADKCHLPADHVYVRGYRTKEAALGN